MDLLHSTDEEDFFIAQILVGKAMEFQTELDEQQATLTINRLAEAMKEG